MVAEKLQFELEVTGQQRATQQINRFGGAVDRVGGLSEKSAGHASALAGAFGNLGTVVATTSPEVGAFAGVIGTAGSAISGLVGVVGVAGGLVGGGLIAALGLLAQSFSDAEKDAKSFHDEVATGEELIASYTTTAKEARQSLIDFAVDEGAALSQLQDLRAQEQEIVQQLRELDKPSALDILPGFGPDEQRIMSLENELDSVRSGIREAEQALTIARQETREIAMEELAEPTVRPSNVKPVDPRGLRGIEDADMAAAGLLPTETVRSRTQRVVARDDAETERLRQERFGGRSGISLGRDQLLGKDEMESVIDQVSDLESAWSTAADTIGNVTTSVFSMIAQGHGDMIDDMLVQLGTQYIAQGLGHILQGGIMLLTYQPQGAGVMAGGAAMVALGASLGGVGAAMGGTSGGGAAAAGAGGAGSRPFNAGGGGRGQDGGTTIININAQMLEPSEDAAMAIGRSVDMARMKRGDVVVRPFQSRRGRS